MKRLNKKPTTARREGHLERTTIKEREREKKQYVARVIFAKKGKKIDAPRRLKKTKTVEEKKR